MRIAKLLTIIFLLTSLQVLASTAFTSSAAFNAALAGTPMMVENYSTFTDKQDIAPGSTFDGITYTSFSISQGTDGIISSQFNSFSGLSLGANQANDTAEFFFDGNSFVIGFAPTYAIGVFFNVNPNSGTFGLNTSAGDASSGSATYDTSTFVFVGLISTTAFTSADIFSTSGGAGTASYNIPEITLAALPEPASVTVTALGLGLLAGLVLRRRAA